MNDSGERSRGARGAAYSELKRVVQRVSARPIGNGANVKITLVVSAQWAGIATAAVAFLDETVASIHRHSETSLRGVRVKAALQRDLAERKAVWRQYDKHREGGLKHRAAVHKLVEDPTLFFHGRWKFSDYNWLMRVRPKDQVSGQES